MKKDEFYIGWMPEAPADFKKFVHRLIAGLAIVVIVTATMLAALQKKFSSADFEFGKLTEVKGVYMNAPVPFLKVFNRKDIFGNNSFITIPLVGFGKKGAAGVISGIEKQENISLDKKEVTLRGTLLFNDGKLLMQVDANDSFLVHVGLNNNYSQSPRIKDLGEKTIKGEIVDPKCFFGVMKPGEGKPHKDCAIRCILGGIPPVLKVTADNGNNNYYLLVGSQGENINEAVKNFVAAPVSVNARAVEYDDWIILYVHDNGISRNSYLQDHFGTTIASCGMNAFKK